jgi:hypothetical protein
LPVIFYRIKGATAEIKAVRDRAARFKEKVLAKKLQNKH